MDLPLRNIKLNKREAVGSYQKGQEAMKRGAASLPATPTNLLENGLIP
jgi:hypothetical protein